MRLCLLIVHPAALPWLVLEEGQGAPCIQWSHLSILRVLGFRGCRRMSGVVSVECAASRSRHLSIDPVGTGHVATFISRLGFNLWLVWLLYATATLMPGTNPPCLSSRGRSV